MVDMPTTRTAEAFPLAGSGVDGTAFGARLRTVGGGHFYEETAGPCELVAEHLREAGPSRVCDVAGQVAPDHACDVELFDHDDAVAIGQSCRLDTQGVPALARGLAVRSHHTARCFLSSLGPFLAAGAGALSARKARHGARVEAGIRGELAVGVGK